MNVMDTRATSALLYLDGVTSPSTASTRSTICR